ncbi:MAG: tetratricopeptide repeat protein [Bacteroidia bacterium]|nr:tetratricopeptide repeat protein [Bacteroidia bacterium]
MENATNSIFSFFCKYKFVIVFVFAFLLYSNTISHYYAYDDATVITDNKDVLQGIKGIPTILTNAYRHGWDGKDIGHYRPFSLLTFAIEYELFGKNPVVSHLINVLLYAIIAVLLLLTLLRILKNYTIVLPLLTTLLFIAHPVHSEVISNIKSRDEILAFLNGILAIHFLFKYVDDKRDWDKYLSALFLFLALTGKESAITLIAIMPIGLYFFRDLKVKQCLLHTTPQLIAVSLFLLLELLFVESLEFNTITAYANSIVAADGFVERWATNFYVLGKYFMLLLFPHPLVHDYSYEQIPVVNWFHPVPIISLIIYLGLIIYVIKNISTKSIIAFGIIFFLITISIVSNIIIIIGSTMAERFLFTPSLGFCLISAYLIIKVTKVSNDDHDFSHNRQIGFIAISTIILASYSLKTFSRNFVWKDNYTLFSADIKNGSENARMLYSMGSAIMYKGHDQINNSIRDSLYNTGIAYLENSIKKYEINDNAYYNIGICYSKMKNYKRALSYFEKTLEITPIFIKAQMNIGNCYSSLKEYDKSIAAFLKVLQIQPGYAMAYNNLGDTYKQSGNNDLAMHYFKQAIAIDSNNIYGHFNLGVEHYLLKNLTQSLYHLKSIVKIDQDEVKLHREFDLYNKLSVLYKKLGDMEKSMTYFRKAETLSIQ